MTEEIIQPFVAIPPEWTNADVAAIQALVTGTATKDQQKRALAFIIYNIANVNDVEYRTNDRDHAFASGRRFCGLQINKMISINLMAFQDESQGED